MADRLLEAAESFDVERFCRLVSDEGVDLKSLVGPVSESVMHHAARNSRHGAEMVRVLASQGLAADERDLEGEEPVHYATRAGNFELAERLLRLRRLHDEQEARNNLLHFFVKQNKLQLVEMVHEHDPRLILARGERGETALHLAAKHADIDVSRWLVANGVPTGAKDEQLECTALAFVAFRPSGHRELVRFLVSLQDVYVNKKGKGKMTALHHALQHGRHEMADELMRFGADLRLKMSGKVNNVLHFCIKINSLAGAKQVHAEDKKLMHECGSSGTTAVHHAAMHADEPMLRWLDDKDAAVHAVDRDLHRANALHFAAFNQQSEQARRRVVRCLVSLNVGVNQVSGDGQTPLHLALRHRNAVVADELVRHAADLGAEWRGLNLLLFCARLDYLEGARLLLEHRPSLIAGRDRDGANAAHVAARHSDLRMCRWLLARDCALAAAATPTGATVLHMAAGNRTHGLQLVRFFVQRGVPVDCRDASGCSPLHDALRHRNLPVARELVALGADVSVKIDAATNMLHLAVLDNFLDGAKLVHDADPALVKGRGLRGKNALHIAAKYADARMCEWLVEQGADSSELTDHGKSVGHYAARRSDKQVKHFCRHMGMNKHGFIKRFIAKYL